jgi:predicted component of type VI protein secretion system
MGMAKALVLTSISGARLGVRYTLTGRSNMIGSASGCDLMLTDKSVQPRHVEVKQLLESWFVVPLSSGVYINGALVGTQGRLRPGDSLIIGSCGFRVAIEEVVEQAVGRGQARAGVPRIGDYLVRQALLTRTQLDHALRHQEDLTSQGRRTQIGTVLVQLGYIRQPVLDAVLREQQTDLAQQWRD